MVEQATAISPKALSLEDRILQDSRFAPFLTPTENPLTPTTKPQSSLVDLILADPAFQSLLDQLSAPPTKPSTDTIITPPSVITEEPIPVVPTVTIPEVQALPNTLKTIQSKLSELKTGLSKVPVSDTAMWQRLSSQISLLANQEAQMLKKWQKNAAFSARWHLEEAKDFVKGIPGKKAAWTVAGLGTVGVVATQAPAISTAAQAFSAPRAAIVQAGNLPSYGIDRIEEQAKPVTSGTLLTEKPTFFRPGSLEPVEFIHATKKLTVLRPAGNYRFLVQTPMGEMEIPMDQLDVQGKLSWEKETRPVKWLGFEFPSAQDMHKMTELGAGFVRIPIEQADQKFFKENPEVIPAIEAAKDRNLEILLLFNPTQTLNLPELKNRLNNMLNLAGNYPKVVFELGNEPDLDIFWEKGDLDSYAEFVKAASSYLWQQQPDAKIVIAAASQREKIQPLINKLKQHGVDLSKFTFAVHAYNDPSEVTKRANLVKAVLGPNAPFIFDELGVNISDSAKDRLIIQMINNAIASGAQRVGIFQLYNVQFVGGDGLWGYLDPDGKWLPPAKRLMNFAWEETHQ